MLICPSLSSALPAALAQEGGPSVGAGWSIVLPEDTLLYEESAVRKLHAEFSALFDTDILIVSQADANCIAVGSASLADVSGMAENGSGICRLVAAAYRFPEEYCDRRV